MNVLITSDDGIDSVGLTVLRDAVKQAGIASNPIVIVPPTPHSGKGMAVSQTWMDDVVKVETDVYTLDATPADIIYRAFCETDQFSKRPWDLVLVGCNHGANLGFDIWHSGTVGAAMTAAKGMGCCAMAFSQDLPRDMLSFTDWSKSQYGVERKHFASAERIIPDFLRRHAPDAGACWNVNIPEEATRGYKETNAAHYSYARTPPTKLVPRAKNDGSDVDYMLQGYVSVSLLDPRTSPPMKY